MKMSEQIMARECNAKTPRLYEAVGRGCSLIRWANGDLLISKSKPICPQTPFTMVVTGAIWFELILERVNTIMHSKSSKSAETRMRTARSPCSQLPHVVVWACDRHIANDKHALMPKLPSRVSLAICPIES
jgi:hypothetical protein